EVIGVRSLFHGDTLPTRCPYAEGVPSRGADAACRGKLLRDRRLSSAPRSRMWGTPRAVGPGSGLYPPPNRVICPTLYETGALPRKRVFSPSVRLYSRKYEARRPTRHRYERTDSATCAVALNLTIRIVVNSLRLRQ